MKRLLSLLIILFILGGCQPAESPDSADSATAGTAPATETAEPTATAEDPHAQREETCHLTIGWDPWEPYHHIGSSGHVEGLDIDLVKAAAARTDCELAFQQGSWASLLQLVRGGELDLLLGATPTSERSTYARFSEPYRQESFELFVRADELERWSDMTLVELLDSGFRLGITQGYVYNEEISRLLIEPDYQGQIIEAAVGDLNFTHLMDYRIDGFIEDPFVTTSIQRRRDWGLSIEPLPIDIRTGEVHMMFSRESVSPETVERFNQALADLRESGEYERILNRYRLD